VAWRLACARSQVTLLLLTKFGDDDGAIEFDIGGMSIFISMHKTFLSLLLIRATTAAVVVLGSLLFPGDETEAAAKPGSSNETKKDQ
jgi:hypothetical protein